MEKLELEREWYAADKQDIYLRDHLFEGKKDGFYVDIGSADGLYKSNTFLLERDLGWDGVCIEARTDAFQKCSLRRKAKCFNFVMGNGEMVEFKENYTGSTITTVGSGTVAVGSVTPCRGPAPIILPGGGVFLFVPSGHR